MPDTQPDIRKHLDGLTEALEALRAEHQNGSTSSSDLTDRVEQYEQARIKRQWWGRWVLMPAITLLMGGGGYSGYRAVDERVKEAEPHTQEVKDTITSRVGAVEGRVGTMEKKVQRLGEYAVEQKVQMVGGIDYVSKKLDAVHGAKTKQVTKPDAWQRAETQVREIQRRDAVKKLFEEPPEGEDPFLVH